MFDNWNPATSWNKAVIAGVVVSIITVVGLVIIVCLIIKCCKKSGPPSFNLNMQNTNPSAPIMSVHTPVDKSQVQMGMANNSVRGNIDADGRVKSFLRNIEREKPTRFSREELKGYTQSYSTKLGSGGFGEVFKGTLPQGIIIAVKVLLNHLGKEGEQQFMAEVGALGRTYHTNLVRLFGFCVESDFCALVYEYMENGSLDKFLFSQDSNGGISFPMLHGIAVRSARGIRYLHEECEQRIIHYDIKPANILLNEKYNPKVADFGLAQLLSREKTHVTLLECKGTAGYMAPEMCTGIGITEKCDVYSFGMLLFEIIGRRKNYKWASNISESQRDFTRMVWEWYRNGRVREMISSVHGMMDEEDREKAERMCKIALWCIQNQPERRPTMSDVVKMLEGEMDYAPPLNPFEYLSVPILPFNLSSGSCMNSSSN